MNEASNEEWLSSYEQQEQGPLRSSRPTIMPFSSDTEEEIIVSGDEEPLITEGEYTATCLGSEVLNTRWGPKICLTLQIQGQPDETTLTKHYNIKITGKSPERGKTQWEAGTRSNYVRDHRRLFGKKRSVSRSAFHRKIFLVQVVTVTTDSKGWPLGEENHYSKVDKLIEVIE